MRSLSPRRIIIAAALLLLAGGGVWLAIMLGWFAPAPTRSGWPANLTTMAGDGIRGHVDGAGAGARFSDPFAIAVAPGGTLYVADAGDTNRIRKVDAVGNGPPLPGAFATL